MKKLLLIFLFFIFLFGIWYANIFRETRKEAVAIEKIEGYAEVIDADDLRIKEQRVKFQGIDAPEYKQPCELADGTEFYPSREAGEWLKSLIADQIISCHLEGIDRFNRKLATCYVKGRNINKMLVEEGHAFVYRHYSTRYIEHEKEAESNKRGLWRGHCEKPWAWRKEQRRKAKEKKQK